MTEGIYILLGSNLGDKKKKLEAAATAIDTAIGPVIRKSFFYKTSAWGNTEQPSFYNQVLEIASELTPQEILKQINRIELALGRVRQEKWGARIIDIDILYYEQEVISSPELTVPHPGIPDRRFTLVPLTELAPDLIHPVLRKTNAELLHDCTDKLEVEKILHH